MTQIESTDTALRLAIVRRAFTSRRRGYDTGEVDELLETVSKLVDDLLRATAEPLRLLAGAETELVALRAEVLELRQAKTDAELLLAETWAELQAQGQSPGRDTEAAERLVVAEAELRVLRASAEDSELSLAEACEDLTFEQSARATAEQQLADVSAQLAELTAERSRDSFAEFGDEIAGLLEAAAETAGAARQRARQEAEVILADAVEARQAADTALAEAEAVRKRATEDARQEADAILAEAEEARQQARQEAEAILAEASELAGALLEDAEVKATAAEEQVRSTLESATVEADRIIFDMIETTHAEEVERDVRRGLEEAADSLLEAAGGSMNEFTPFAMECNGAEHRD